MFVRPRHRRAPGALTRPVDRRLVEAGLPTCKAPPSNPATSNARCRGRHRSIDDASAWLEQYFDTESTQVAAALATIDEIRGGMFSVTPPDISQSLRLLRQFRTLSESAQ